jgi:hypothetical protein
MPLFRDLVLPLLSAERQLRIDALQPDEDGGAAGLHFSMKPGVLGQSVSTWIGRRIFSIADEVVLVSIAPLKRLPAAGIARQ